MYFHRNWKKHRMEHFWSNAHLHGNERPNYPIDDILHITMKKLFSFSVFDESYWKQHYQWKYNASNQEKNNDR